MLGGVVMWSRIVERSDDPKRLALAYLPGISPQVTADQREDQGDKTLRISFGTASDDKTIEVDAVANEPEEALDSDMNAALPGMTWWDRDEEEVGEMVIDYVD